MEQRSIGSLGVSVIGLGTNQFGTQACDEAASARILGEALDAGVTFIDTADEYGAHYSDPTDLSGRGRSEEIVGQAVRARRDEVVVATKFGSPLHAAHGLGGASAAWVKEAAEASLRRLDTDRIDLFQLHFPDDDTPIEETLQALTDLVNEGKVREIGCCNLSAEQLREADAAAAGAGLRPFVSLQSELNLFRRSALDGVLPACDELGLSFIPYYPLASGMLTGKYRRGRVPTAGTRLAEQVSDEARRRLFSDRTFDRIEALEAFASARGRTLLELALGWLLAQPTVATVIAGAAKSGQAAANAVSGGWRLTADEAAEVTRVVVEAAP
jgi:aryl-alcohol dehydrogenase-like predicted oxidoreductase